MKFMRKLDGFGANLMKFYEKKDEVIEDRA